MKAFFEKYFGTFMKFCPKSGRFVGFRVEKGAKLGWARVVLPFVGFAALCWIVFRVITKPSRISYPCIRASLPLAVYFLMVIGTPIVATYAFGKNLWRSKKYRRIVTVVFVPVFMVAMAWGVSAAGLLPGENYRSMGTFVRTNPPLTPLGYGFGIFPGRVAWMHDPMATSYDGRSSATNRWWHEHNNNQAVICGMLEAVVLSVAGGNDIAESWDLLFRCLNVRLGRGDVGFSPDQTIAVKLNLNSGGGTNNRVDASPQLVYSMLDQLVNHVGVPQENILLFDATRQGITAVRDHNRPHFPNVRFNDIWVGGSIPRVVEGAITYSIDPLSNRRITYAGARRIPQDVVDADYMINMFVMKRHSLVNNQNWHGNFGQTGVTLGGKNHFGTIMAPWALHNTIQYWRRFPLGDDPPRNVYPFQGTYSPVVDLMGSRHMQKTVLHIMDALYTGEYHGGSPQRWYMSPFYGHWPSSVFASQDPIAIDSVGLDFLAWEWPLVGRADNYLIEAALAHDPPSGTYYAPDGVRLHSLGIHEHWNNPVEKLYSRNLGLGYGIELVHLHSPPSVSWPQGDRPPVVIPPLPPRHDESSSVLWIVFAGGAVVLVGAVVAVVVVRKKKAGE